MKKQMIVSIVESCSFGVGATLGDRWQGFCQQGCGFLRAMFAWVRCFDKEAVHGVTVDALQATYGNELVEFDMTDTLTGKALTFKRSSMCV